MEWIILGGFENSPFYSGLLRWMGIIPSQWWYPHIKYTCGKAQHILAATTVDYHQFLNSATSSSLDPTSSISKHRGAAVKQSPESGVFTFHAWCSGNALESTRELVPYFYTWLSVCFWTICSELRWHQLSTWTEASIQIRKLTTDTWQVLLSIDLQYGIWILHNISPQQFLVQYLLQPYMPWTDYKQFTAISPIGSLVTTYNTAGFNCCMSVHTLWDMFQTQWQAHILFSHIKYEYDNLKWPIQIAIFFTHLKIDMHHVHATKNNGNLIWRIFSPPL